MKRLLLFLLLAFPFLFLSIGLLRSDQSDISIRAGGIGTISFVGGGNGNIIISNSGVIHYPDITFYDAMDSSTTGRVPTKGSGTLTISGDAITPGTPLSSSSTASLNGSINDGFKRIAVQESGNISLSAGRAGFYFVWDTATNDSSCAFGWLPSGDASPRFAFRKGNSGNTWSFKYEDVSIDRSLIAGTTYYVEIAWDHSKANGYCAKSRVDNGSFTSSNACTTATPTNGTSFGLMGDSILSSGHSLDGRMDEVIISSNSERDLYAIRNIGNYPN